MAKEFPSPEQLKREREETGQKVADVTEAKNKDVAKKADLISGEIRETLQSLYDQLTEAQKNYEYYMNLKQERQLLEEDLNKPKEMEELVQNIKNRISEYEARAGNTMKIPEVGKAVVEQAENENTKIELDRKRKKIETDIAEWIDNLLEKYDKLTRDLNTRIKLLEESEEKVRSLIKRTMGDIERDFDYSNLRKSLEEYKHKAGFWEFTKKKEADLILNSHELVQYEASAEDLDSMNIELEYSGGYQNSSNIVNHLFKTNPEPEEAYKKIKKFAQEDPSPRLSEYLDIYLYEELRKKSGIPSSIPRFLRDKKIIKA